jgi:hypothetical protein
MTKVCKRHSDNPVMIYHQCVGCELEWFHEELEQKQQEIERLRQERDKLIETLRWYADEDTYEIQRRVLGNFALISSDQGQRARDILREVGVTTDA